MSDLRAIIFATRDAARAVSALASINRQIAEAHRQQKPAHARALERRHRALERRLVAAQSTLTNNPI